MIRVASIDVCVLSGRMIETQRTRRTRRRRGAILCICLCVPAHSAFLLLDFSAFEGKISSRPGSCKVRLVIDASGRPSEYAQSVPPAVSRRLCRPAGAGNTAVNIASLGGQASLAGVIGADSHGSQPRAAMTVWPVRNPGTISAQKSFSNSLPWSRAGGAANGRLLQARKVTCSVDYARTTANAARDVSFQGGLPQPNTTKRLWL
jgi:hypothetical protein